MAALFSSCSVSEDLEMEVPSADDCILEVAVGLDDGEKTRGLSGDASSITATWQAGDKVLVYKDNTKVGELTPVSTGSAETKLRGKLSGTYDSYAAGSKLTLYYNTTSTSFSSFTQDGTLATILANLRYQSATMTIQKASDRPTLSATAAVTFELAANNPSINHFTLNKAMKTLRVCVKGSSTILVSATAASPTTDFYVAIPAAASQTYYIEGVDARQSEYFQAKTAALSANKYYSASITLAEYPLTFEPVSATTVTIPNSQGLTYQYSTNDGASWTSSSDASVAVSVSAEQRLMVRRLTGNYANNIGTITNSQPCLVYGNVHSLFGFRNKLTGSFGKNGYYELFKDQTNLTNHGFRNICIVPVDGTNKAYDMANMFFSMFSGCTSLTIAPVLDLSNWNTSNVEDMSNMFSSMFSDCTSLTIAPVLDLSNLDTSSVFDMNGMFSSMFSGCGNLNAVKMKLTNTTILGDTSGFRDFLKNAKEPGTLTVSSGTTSYWNDIKAAGYIPSGWTITEQ